MRAGRIGGGGRRAEGISVGGAQHPEVPCLGVGGAERDSDVEVCDSEVILLKAQVGLASEDVALWIP